MSRVPSGSTASARYTALLRTVASSRILTRSASKKTTGYIGSRGRLCHAVISATTASVTVLIRSGDTSTAYISERNAWISRTVMPRAYSRTGSHGRNLMNRRDVRRVAVLFEIEEMKSSSQTGQDDRCHARSNMNRRDDLNHVVEGPSLGSGWSEV